MESGISKWCGVALLLLLGCCVVKAQYQVKATALTYDVKDLSQRDSKVFDQNGERCALIIFETAIPKLFTFNLGAQQIEKRVNKDDEVWIWVSPDVKKMTIRCTDCTPLKDYRVSLKSGNVYHSKLTTGLPQEIATSQNVLFYCEQTPFTISIDGATPVESKEKSFHTVLPIGEHDIAVSSKLYKPYTGSFHVNRSRTYTDTIRLEDNFGELFFTVTPSNYTVYVNDEPREAGRSLRLEPGIYRIAVKKDRYSSFETTVNLMAKDQRLIRADLNPNFAVFSITAAEDGTEIWVDGMFRGNYRTSIELDFGEHRIEGRREGYDTWEYTNTQFTETSQRAIRIPKLNQQFGRMRLSFYPQEAQVFVDGKLVNAQEGVYMDGHVPTGLHFVQARMTDYTSVRDSFTIRNGKMYVGDYVLQPLALGRATITTDQGIGIYRREQDSGDMAFLGHSSYTGKFPAGENVIELRSLSDISCQYKIFINDKQDHAPVYFPFQRKLMIRSNVVGQKIMLKGGPYPAYPIRANKNLKIDPMKYEISVTKKGYQEYKDSIDLTNPNVKKLIYRAKLTKQKAVEDSVPRKRYTSPRFLQRFYDNAGTLFIGIFDFGYTFDFNGTNSDPKQFNHVLTVGALPLRYRMVGFNFADFEFAVNNENLVSTVCYTPRLSLFIPVDRGFAVRMYGGMALNLYDIKHVDTKGDRRLWVLGGAALRFNYIGKFPMDLFAEYKWPINKNAVRPETNKELYFRVGISFSVGVDL